MGGKKLTTPQNYPYYVIVQGDEFLDEEERHFDLINALKIVVCPSLFLESVNRWFSKLLCGVRAFINIQN